MEEKILQILKERGMRMSNLAAKLGVDQSNLSKKLKNDPKASLLERIATALEVPVSSFFPDQLPAESAGVLNMGGKRFALVPLPDEAVERSDIPPEAHNLTPGALQERIYSMALQCSKDGKTRAVYGFLAGHLVVVVHDGVSKRYLRLFWEKNGSVSEEDYPSRHYEGWKSIQLAELIVHDIISTSDL
ncbi:MAG: helix-turn-helix domain-containing protein [Bacteroidales bacterium]|nr:helix-turn-helix domain-containing protein [Bacteroidales bacterium]